MAEAQPWYLWIRIEVCDILWSNIDARFEYREVWSMLITEPAIIRGAIDGHYVKKLR
jgi:hypothetical protein